MDKVSCGSFYYNYLPAGTAATPKPETGFHVKEEPVPYQISKQTKGRPLLQPS